MPDKQAIFDNIEMFDADELLQFIKTGIVTFDELCKETDGYFPPQIRKTIASKLAGSEDEDWEKIKNSDSIDELMRYLKSYPKSPHCNVARERIIQLGAQVEEKKNVDVWVSVDKNNIDALREFCQEFPDDSHSIEALRIINKLQKENFLGFDVNALINRINSIQTDKTVNDPDSEIYKTISSYIDRGKVKINDLLDAIRNDNNLLRATVLDRLITNGYFEYKDFLAIDIDRRFILHLANNEHSQSFMTPKRIDKINKLSTEIYFWGIPSSGKSCVLGAILSVANNGSIAQSMSKDNDCQGYGYMTRLAQLFKSDGSVGTLPEGTSIYSTYEMGFDLEDVDKASHPLTCVDLAGELVRCMYKSDAHEPMSDDELESLDTLTRILIDNRTQNRKIHFFVLEYGGEKRRYEGLSQTEYLAAALRYIERTGIFKNDTDAIYLMITKVDKANAKGHELQDKLKNYISVNYQGFYHGLEKICRDCEINGGVVEIVPFSLGKVCFQDYCLFTEGPAANVVRKLLVRSKGFKNSKIQKGFNLFKK